MAGSKSTMKEGRDPFGDDLPINRLIQNTSVDTPPAPASSASVTPIEEKHEKPNEVVKDDTRKPPPKEKVTVLLPLELVERLRNVAWHKRETLASLAEDGIRDVVERLEKRNGGPFEPRGDDLKPGRPQGTRNVKNRVR